jgi:hypothetical protein
MIFCNYDKTPGSKNEELLRGVENIVQLLIKNEG